MYLNNKKYIFFSQDIPKLNIISNKSSGPGKLLMNILTVVNVSFNIRISMQQSHVIAEWFQIYIIGEDDVPNLVFPKSELLQVNPYLELK